MSDAAIRVEGLTKCYRIGGPRARYQTLRDTIVDTVKAPLRRLRGGHAYQDQTIWALKDISLEVKRGEVVGIIGRNGAGKTTLLKVLSRITGPSEGYAEITGRIGSLLEVGTGFHPEMTGRENIYLNGAILGMKKKEIERKFDEIVAFAGVEKFLNTPVKRYSSGMYVRLAFAVAAHLEPEILLVDEVLAVGDYEFQKKCLGKMGDVAKGGRTVLFVSHNMGAIRQLVSRCILLEEGRVTFDGNKGECISKYLQSSFSETGSRTTFPDHHPTKEFPVAIKGAALKAEDGRYKTDFSLGEPWCLEMELEAIRDNVEFQASLNIQNEFGIYVYHFVSWDTGQESFCAGISSKLSIILPKLMLYPAQYSVHLWIGFPGASSRRMDKIESAISFTVDQSAGLEVTRPLGKGMAVVHEVPIWKIKSS